MKPPNSKLNTRILVMNVMRAPKGVVVFVEGLFALGFVVAAVLHHIRKSKKDE